MREILRWSIVAGAGFVLLFMIGLAQAGKFNKLIYRPLDMEDYWVTIPAGEFQMGSENGENDEKPVHAVYLDPFEIGRYEVTNRQFAQCVRAGVCNPPTNKAYTRQEFDLFPVTDVSWYDAANFCKWVDGRLPTEAEWEKAARGGLGGKIYSWGDESATCREDQLNAANVYGEGCSNSTMPVGSFPANGYGLFDTVGNVWEWVNDWYSETYYSQSPAANPMGPENGEFRVLRGGSWFYTDFDIRSSNRRMGKPSGAFNYYYFGFRCSRDASP